MQGVSKVFRTAAGNFEALKDINVGFYPGEFVSIVGKSGSGKSTLINMVTGIDHPSQGTVCIGNTDIHQMGESGMAVWRGRNLGIVFQFFQLLPMLSILENTLLPMDFCNMYPVAERETRAMDLLAMVGLEDFARKLPSELSGGQQQAAAIARALANDPPIIVADEPTGNLDSRTADIVFDIFTNLVSHGKTVLMVTHDRGLAERTNRVLVIVDGELVNEAISSTFLTLPHAELLWLTKHMQADRLEPGEVIARGRAPSTGLFLVRRGQLELGAVGGGGRLLRAGPGEFISPSDLKALNLPDAELRAAPGRPVEFLQLESANLQTWFDRYPPAHNLLENSAADRLLALRVEAIENRTGGQL
jgi:putative ABC transport system ATP-binding protein